MGGRCAIYKMRGLVKSTAAPGPSDIHVPAGRLTYRSRSVLTNLHGGFGRYCCRVSTHTRELILIGSNVGPSNVGLVYTWDPIELC